MLLLSFNSNTEYAYIETANLDGEKNLKPKIPVFGKFRDEVDILTGYPLIEVTYKANEE